MSLSFFMVLWVSGILVGLAYLMSGWSVFLAGIVTLAALTMAFIKAEYCFYLMILLFPVEKTHFLYNQAIAIRIPNFDSVFVFPYMLAAVLAAVALFVRGALGKRPPGIIRTPLTGIVAFIVVYLCASYLWAPNKTLALFLGILLLLYVYIFFLMIHFIRDADSLRKTLNVMMITGIIASTGVIVSMWVDYKETFPLVSGLNFEIIFGEMENRPAGFGPHNVIAGLLAFLALLAIGRALASERTRDKVIHSVIASYMTIGVILTVCRGALVGILVGVVVLMTAHPLARTKAVKYSAIIFALIFCAIMVTKPSYIDRILIGFGYTGTLYFSQDLGYGSSYTGSEEGTSGLDARKKWWKKGLAVMAERPLTFIFGLGMGGFINHTESNHTHSLPLSFFYDMGLVGVVILMICVMILSRNFIFYITKAKRTYSYYMFLAAVAAFVAEIGVHGLIDYDFYFYSAKIVWVSLGYVLAALNIVRSENPELESEIT